MQYLDVAEQHNITLRANYFKDGIGVQVRYPANVNYPSDLLKIN